MQVEIVVAADRRLDLCDTISRRDRETMISWPRLDIFELQIDRVQVPTPEIGLDWDSASASSSVKCRTLSRQGSSRADWRNLYPFNQQYARLSQLTRRGRRPTHIVVHVSPKSHPIAQCTAEIATGPPVQALLSICGLRPDPTRQSMYQCLVTLAEQVLSRLTC